ncbi:MAG TPA: phage portal protein [Pirellulales bacterium]|nr:phage portal protein [Pirellulales bacterium]
MPSFTSQRDYAQREADSGYERCVKAAQQRLSPERLLTASGGNVNLKADGYQRLADAREQQSHFRGQVYTSVRPIAQRIAGQPIRLARIGRRGKRRQAEPRQYILPEWVRELAVVHSSRHTPCAVAAHRTASAHKGYGTRSVPATIELVDQHPILDSLHQPAPSVPGWNDWCLKYVSVASLEVTGYAYWWFPIVAGRREIWYLPSHWVRPMVSDARIIDGWAVKTDGQAEETLLAADEITPFWYPDPANPLRGLGPLEAGGRSIMIDEFVQEAQKRAFQLGIHPGAIITVGSQVARDGTAIKPRLRKWQQEQIREAILSRYRGLAHFGEPLIKDALIESIEAWGNKPKEMDFGGNMDKTQARVEQTFGTHPYIAGAAGLGSRAESGEADRHFVYQTVNPKIELLSRVLTIGVLPRFDASSDYVLFIEPARPRDSEMETREWEDGLKYACVTVNEFRTHVLRLPPLAGGDVALVPSTAAYAPIGGATSPAPSPETPMAEEEEVAEGEEAE